MIFITLLCCRLLLGSVWDTFFCLFLCFLLFICPSLFISLIPHVCFRRDHDHSSAGPRAEVRVHPDSQSCGRGGGPSAEDWHRHGNYFLQQHSSSSSSCRCLIINYTRLTFLSFTLFETRRSKILLQPAHFCFIQVNITILDINDNAPVWRDEPYHANVVEMSPKNTDVISVSALSLAWLRNSCT